MNEIRTPKLKQLNGIFFLFIYFFFLLFIVKIKMSSWTVSICPLFAKCGSYL